MMFFTVLGFIGLCIALLIRLVFPNRIDKKYADLLAIISIGVAAISMAISKF